MSEPYDPPADGTQQRTPEVAQRQESDALLAAQARTGDYVEAGAVLLPPGVTSHIGGFKIEEVLGKGFGLVYRASDATLDRQVAIKVPHRVGLTAESRERFFREARATSKISHPNVCRVYAAGEDENGPYIVMQFVAGGTLADLLKRGRPTVPSAILIARKIALGLEAAHAREVVQRDLRPANVLFDKLSQEFLIADFGLARVGLDASLTWAGAGTPLYMSPEQAREIKEEIGPCSDVYSLGIILYQMLTGDVPFKDGSRFDIQFAHWQTVPQPPSSVRPGLDKRLDALCLKALAKNPTDRYASAKDFARALADYLRESKSEKSHKPQPARETTTAPSPEPPALTTIDIPTGRNQHKQQPKEVRYAGSLADELEEETEEPRTHETMFSNPRFVAPFPTVRRLLMLALAPSLFGAVFNAGDLGLFVGGWLGVAVGGLLLGSPRLPG